MFHGSYPNTPGLVTAPVGLPSLLPAFHSLKLPWWPTRPHCNSSKQPVLFPLPVIRVAALNLKMSVQHTPEKPPCFALLFHALLRPLSPSWFEPLWWGVMFTPLLHRLCCRPGQASCCSSNSVMLNSDVGCIKLVIFQAWSVLGRCMPSGSVRRLKKKSKVEWKKKTEALLFCVFFPRLNVRRLFPLKSVGEQNSVLIPL